MLELYRVSEPQAQAAAALGVDDIERRQHVQQLTRQVLSGCKQASLPFTWLRACGLQSIAEALSAGLDDPQALAAVLEATYSQVLEVILSALDLDLIQPTPQPPKLHNTATLTAQTITTSSKDEPLTDEQQAALLAAVGRYPAGHAPMAASSGELVQAYRVMQVLCLLHVKSRGLLRSAQNLQLVTARACEAPDCLPHALHTLLTLMQGNEEAQAMFVTTGGLDMLLTRTLQHTSQERQQQAAAAGNQALSSGSSNGGPPELLVQLLVFLQMLLGWGIGEAVRKGAHPSTQRAAVSLMARHLGPDSARTLTQGLTQLVLNSGAAGPSGMLAAAAAANFVAGGGIDQVLVEDGQVSVEDILKQRSIHAASTVPLSPK